MDERISDQARQSDGGVRLREYTRQERRSGMHPAIAALRSRPKVRGEENRKAAEFLRIERGHTA